MKKYHLETPFDEHKAFLFTRRRDLAKVAEQCESVANIFPNDFKGKYWYSVQYDPRFSDAPRILRDALDGAQ